jgi:2-polyprenyl-3-methyl-5-hydroxy-6-metoxy-1,4-benzoquinol methylase
MLVDRTPLWKKAARDLTPPILWRTASAAARALGMRGSSLEADEQDAVYYDEMYQRDVEYEKHYTASRYYFLWSVILDRLKSANVRSVLDVGCGPGQFALLLRDAGVPRYHGIDLSKNAVERAKAACPDYQFTAASVFDADLLERLDYDAVISLEFLEHVAEDVAVVRRIRPGARFYGSVPNFPNEAHVRHFADCAEVTERYGSYFTKFRVDAFLGCVEGLQYFLMDGVRA